MLLLHAPVYSLFSFLSLHAFLQPTISRMSPESAEICKLGLNCFVTMKISYALRQITPPTRRLPFFFFSFTHRLRVAAVHSNQIGDICDRTPGADKDAVLTAIGADSRVGKKCIKAGYGFGGPCFPRDNRALGIYAKSVGIDPKLMIATDEYNEYHADRMVEKLLAEGRDEVFPFLPYSLDGFVS